MATKYERLKTTKIVLEATSIVCSMAFPIPFLLTF